MHNIEDRLTEILNVLKISHKENIEAVQRNVLAGSSLRKQIYEECDGVQTVGQIATKVTKSIQQVSNNLAILESASLIREVRKGKAKSYIKVR